MKKFLALLSKDFMLELRHKETISLLLCLALLLSLIVSLALNNVFLSSQKSLLLFLPMLWVISVFTGTLSIGRSYEFEIENSALEGVVLSGLPPSLIFLSKTITNFGFTLLAHLLAFYALSAFLDVLVEWSFSQFLLLSILVLIAFSALATILAALSIASRLRSMLLPLILLPLAFPVFFCALELGMGLMDRGELDFNSFWFSFLIALDLFYLAVGSLLFRFVIRE